MQSSGEWLAAGLGAAMMLWASPAWTECLEPNAEFQLEGETVPSTVQGAMYRNCENVEPDEDPEFSLYEAESDTEIPVTVFHDRGGLYEIQFDEDLDEETTYRFEAAPECVGLGPDEPGEWTFDTGESAELPGGIGVWTPTNSIVGQVRYPGQEQCTVEARAGYSRFEFDPSEAGETWGRAIAFETRINQNPWEPQLGRGETVPAGASRIGWGEEVVYTSCEDKEPDLGPHADVLGSGAHRVEFAAHLPGTDKVWLSEAEHVFLECPDEDDSSNSENNDGENSSNDDNSSDDNSSDDSSSEDGETGEDSVDTVDEEEPACNQSGGGGSLAVALLAIGALGLRRRSPI